MLKKRSYLNVVEQPGFGFNIVYNYCFAALLGLLLVFSGQHSSVIADQTRETATQHDNTGLLSNSSFESRISPNQPPFHPSRTPQGQDIPWGSEPEVDFDDDWNPLAGHHSSDGSFNVLLEGSESSPTASSDHNRPTVPFFILYHSWKSFLS